MGVTHRKLHRLDRAYYQGFAIVHWSMTIHRRATGWLNPAFHSAFREALLHATFHNPQSVPVYCLMPDHAHLLTVGMDDTSDQLPYMVALRKEVNRLLAAQGAFHLQDQGYDHVLRGREGEPAGVMEVAAYIAENPVRKKLAAAPAEYPYLGAVIPGYPELRYGTPDFWMRFWRLHASRRKAALERVLSEGAPPP